MPGRSAGGGGWWGTRGAGLGRLSTRSSGEQAHSTRLGPEGQLLPAEELCSSCAPLAAAARHLLRPVPVPGLLLALCVGRLRPLSMPAADACAACHRRSNKRWDDASVSPVIRQTLLHWCGGGVPCPWPPIQPPLPFCVGYAADISCHALASGSSHRFPPGSGVRLLCRATDGCRAFELTEAEFQRMHRQL